MISRETAIDMAIIYKNALMEIAEGKYLYKEAVEASWKALLNASYILQESNATVGDTLENQK